MPTLFQITKPFFHALDPELAHKASILALKTGLGPKYPALDDVRLKTTLWGKPFLNPIGLAAGYDKNAEVIGPMLDIGFGFIEAGGVTVKAQEGLPKPRIFRDIQNEAIINRMNFPNVGMQAFKRNVEKFLEKKPRPKGNLGIQIAMSSGQTEPEKDFKLLIRNLAPFADYILFNVSCPNTPGLRNLEDPAVFADLAATLIEEKNKVCKKNPVPLLAKFSPDLTPERQEGLAKACLSVGIDGISLTNTTTQRPDYLPEAFRERKGGLSGRPLTQRSTDMIRTFYQLTDGKVPIIGLGGVSSGQDAYDKICAGASLVQLYSALVFHGPELVTQICRDLVRLLDEDGHAHLNDAIGSKA